MSAHRVTVRQALAAAAINLFLEKGFDQTTADDIAEAVGVARRTFFRHFRTKEDAALPDHDQGLAAVTRELAAAEPAEPAFEVVARAAHRVLDIYADDPETAVRRYRLIRAVLPLREREIAVTSRYQRLLAGYLNRRLGAEGQAPILHEAAAALVVAAHNAVLREWLRGGAVGDPHERFSAATRAAAAGLPPWLRHHAAPVEPADADRTAVLLVRADTPLWQVAERLRALDP